MRTKQRIVVGCKQRDSIGVASNELEWRVFVSRVRTVPFRLVRCDRTSDSNLVVRRLRESVRYKEVGSRTHMRLKDTGALRLT